MRRGGDGVEGQAGGGRIITMVSDFGEPAPPKHNLGATPLNSLSLITSVEKIGKFRVNVKAFCGSWHKTKSLLGAWITPNKLLTFLLIVNLEQFRLSHPGTLGSWFLKPGLYGSRGHRTLYGVIGWLQDCIVLMKCYYLIGSNIFIVSYYLLTHSFKATFRPPLNNYYDKYSL